MIKFKTVNVIFWSFFIITFSDSKFLINKGYNDFVAYIGYGLLLCIVLYKYIKLPLLYRKKHINKQWIICMVFFSVGIMLQNMPMGTKVRLIATMIIIAVVALCSDGAFKSFYSIRAGAYGILFAMLATTLLAALTGSELTSSVAEGNWSAGFSAGMGHKNNMAMDAIASFSGIYIFNRCQSKKQVDLLAMALLITLIIISHSRGSWMLLAIFIVMMHIEDVKYIYTKQRKLVVIAGLIFGICLGMFLFENIALNSGTYLYRFRGLFNWLEYFKNDWFHLVFGNSELAFKNTGLGYTLNVRAVTGWDGTLEMTPLSVLIKNGMIGFLGYFIIFYKAIKTSVIVPNWRYKACIISIVAVMLISSLTETFIVNINVVYGVYSYAVLAGFCGMAYLSNSTKNEEAKDG